MESAAEQVRALGKKTEDDVLAAEADTREDMKAVRRLPSVVHKLLPPEALP